MQTDWLVVVELVEPPLVLQVADPTRALHPVTQAMKAERERLLQVLVQLKVPRPILKDLLEVLEAHPIRLAAAVRPVELVRLRLERPKLVLLPVVAADPNLD
jgi:hypothetical protein